MGSWGSKVEGSRGRGVVRSSGLTYRKQMIIDA